MSDQRGWGIEKSEEAEAGPTLLGFPLLPFSQRRSNVRLRWCHCFCAFLLGFQVVVVDFGEQSVLGRLNRGVVAVPPAAASRCEYQVMLGGSRHLQLVVAVQSLQSLLYQLFHPC